MKEICTLLVKLYIICSRMQRVNLHARPSIIQLGWPTCCYQVCALDHERGVLQTWITIQSPVFLMKRSLFWDGLMEFTRAGKSPHSHTITILRRPNRNRVTLSPAMGWVGNRIHVIHPGDEAWKSNAVMRDGSDWCYHLITQLSRLWSCVEAWFHNGFARCLALN